MAKFQTGLRLHDYGCGSPDEMFQKITADGFDCCQLAYTKAIRGVSSYEDITGEIIAVTKKAMKQHQVSIGVLGCYLEYAIDHEAIRKSNVLTVKKLIPVAKELEAHCIGFETTDMKLQPPGTSRERGQYLLCKSLEEILPVAEENGVIIAIEPVSWHSMNTPEATARVLKAMQSPALKVIFDAGNLLTADEVDRQEQLWARTEDLLGEYIHAVHFKTQDFRADGSPRACSLAENRINWDLAFEMLHRQNRLIPILREELNPANAAIDIAEMRRLMRMC